MNANLSCRTGSVPQPLPPIRVFVLDDSDFDRAHIKRLCSQSGLNVQFFESADVDAMQADEAFDGCDVFIVDFHLTEETGAQVVQMLRADKRVAEAGIIMVSGIEQEDLMDRSTQSGCDLYLSKDMLSPDLLRKVLVDLYVVRAARLPSQRPSENFSFFDDPKRLEPLVSNRSRGRVQQSRQTAQGAVLFSSVRGARDKSKFSKHWLADEFVFH